MKLIHLSDLHVSTRDSAEYRALRRIVLQIITHHRDAVVVITGDFVNNGTRDEFDVVAALLGPLVTHCRLVLTLPGNHDVERMGALGGVNVEPFFEFRRNLTRAEIRYPYVQDIDGVQLVCLDSTRESGGLEDLARGNIGYTQRLELAKYLEIGTPHTRVVLVHHHPFDRGLGLDLTDADELLATLAGRCDLLLFGHKHFSAQWRGLYGIDWMAASGKSTDDLTYRVFDITDGKITYTDEAV